MWWDAGVLTHLTSIRYLRLAARSMSSNHRDQVMLHTKKKKKIDSGNWILLAQAQEFSLQ